MRIRSTLISAVLLVVLAGALAGCSTGLVVPQVSPTTSTQPQNTGLPPTAAPGSTAPATATAPAAGTAAATPSAALTADLNGQPASTASATSTVAVGGVNTFTASDLGIAFDYQPQQGGETVAAKEIGDKVYVYAGNMDPTQGQWVQVYQKDPSQTLEDAIRSQVLKGYSAQDCLVTTTQDPIAGQKHPDGYVFARIDVPHSPDADMGTLSQLAQKCPQPYAAVGGLAYFMADTQHPDRFVFFSIGQYYIGAGDNLPWQETLRFIDLTPSAANTPAPAVPGIADYFDDRSTPQGVLQSYVNALNRKEYARAYGYWAAASGTAGGPPPFDQFQAGYANTASVALRLGTIGGDNGAGQIRYLVPTTLVAKTTAGATQVFVGCFTLHLAQPAIQATPPFRPLGIESANVKQVASEADAAAQMSSVCANRGVTVSPQPNTNMTDISANNYIDNRSGPVELLRSLFNAVNRKEYDRAYTYWENNQLSLDQFTQGYADTKSVGLTTGTVKSGVGAGQLYYTVPVILKATTTGGAMQTFAGCYTLHLPQPAMQSVPPYHGLAIASANIQPVAAGQDATTVMNAACQGG